MDVAHHYAKQALAYDQNGHHQAAAYFYNEAARALHEAIRTGKASTSLESMARKYEQRAAKLSQDDECALSKDVKSAEEASESRAKFLLSEGLANDEVGKYAEALELYSQGVEFCLKCSKEAAIEEVRNRFRTLANDALERAEHIKRLLKNDGLPEFPEIPSDDLENMTISRDDSTDQEPAIRSPVLPSPKASTLNTLEKNILATTSKINNLAFVPFLKSDLKERFAYPLPFTKFLASEAVKKGTHFRDKDGLLKLSDKQKARFKAWLRPDEICSNPVLIERIDSGTIKQNIIPNCSFISSLAIAARYESRFKTPLVTNIIYPQDKHGKPVYNPCGKYMIKFHINGINRKILIDDRLPVGESNQFLCSYSQNKNELWVSLLEKAYMKVMGGYDFPGSNSNIDLNALTGWIPERIPLKLDNFTTEEKDRVFEKLFQRYHQGHCLITLATGQMSEAEQERSGLVDCHAYAVLDLRKFEDKRLLLLKNPWSHIRWKGNYSEKDLQSWTPDLCKALDYNPKDAQQFDDGVFWINYESVLHFFDVFYVNWDPKLFPYTYCQHNIWHSGQGPVKDLYTITENPQFKLEVNNKNGVVAVWILLTRHIMDRADFADNKEYITIMIYKSGKKIHLPNDPKPLIDGARINSPHYLCQLTIKDAGVQKYTLVVAQYEKSTTIYYSLRVYSTAEFQLSEIKTPFKVKKTLTGEWKGITAGGCGNGESRHTVGNNPIVHVTIDDGSDENALLIDLRGPKQFSVGFQVRLVEAYRKQKTFEARSTDVFRYGCTVMELNSLPAGVYSVQVMAFNAGQEGPFILRVECTTNFALKRVQ